MDNYFYFLLLFLNIKIDNQKYITYRFISIGLTEDHPQWIGAWWLGLAMIGPLLFVVSPFMTLFPSKIPPPKGLTTDAEVCRPNFE